MKQLCKDVQQVLCLLMVLFKFLWLPRFVIELTQRWGCTVQITSEFPNRQTPEDSPSPPFEPQPNFHFLQLIKRPLQVGSFCQLTAAWYWRNQFYLLLPWPGSLLRWRMQLKYQASERDVKQNSDDSSKSRTSANSPGPAFAFLSVSFPWPAHCAPHGSNVPNRLTDIHTLQKTTYLILLY